MNLYPQAPQTIGQVLDSGLNLYRQVLKPVLPLTALLAFLAQLPQLVPYFLLGGGQPGAGMAALLGLGGLVGFIAWFLVYMSLYGGWIRGIDQFARGQALLGAGEAFRFGWSKLGGLIGASILFILAIMLGFVLLIIPGIILLTSLFFYGYLILLEDRTAVAALKESHRLVWGNWWRTLTIFTVAGLIYGVGLFVVGGIAGMLVGIGFSGPGPDDIAAGFGIAPLIYFLVQVALNALLLPMWNAMVLVQFRDLQLRKSGSDLAARAAAA